MAGEGKKNPSTWTFLTNHAHVLLSLAGTSTQRIRDLAGEVGITERAVQRILSELTEDGYIERTRDGRTNKYKINESKTLKHPIESHCKISDLIRLINNDVPAAVPDSSSTPSGQ